MRGDCSLISYHGDETRPSLSELDNSSSHLGLLVHRTHCRAGQRWVVPKLQKMGKEEETGQRNYSFHGCNRQALLMLEKGGGELNPHSQRILALASIRQECSDHKKGPPVSPAVPHKEI